MKEYAKFLVKRILLRKSNIFLFLGCTALLVFVLVMNIRTQDRLRNTFNNTIEIYENSINEYTTKLSNVEEDSDEYWIYKATIESNMRQHQNYIELSKYYDNEEWSVFYDKYQSLLENDIESTANSFEDIEQSEPSLSSMKKQLVYIQYLDDKQLAYEDKEFPIYGLTFITFVSQVITPILILICCVYILAQAFTMDYAKDIDISKLLPIGRGKTCIIKLVVGISVSILIFLTILVVVFILSSFITSNTGMEYPFITQNKESMIWTVTGLLSLLKDWILLGNLFYIAISIFVYLMANFIKEEGPLFLTVLCVVLGITYMPTIVGSLRPIAQYLPTTYMSFVNVVNGSLANQYANVNISFMNGVIILSFYILMQVIICFIINQSHYNIFFIRKHLTKD